MTIELTVSASPDLSTVLTPAALDFVGELARAFSRRRTDLLARRDDVQARWDAGERPDFLPETAHIRAAAWQVVAPAPELLDRRVEITGPVDRKMIINALNSGANVFMADFEDSSAPSFANMVEGQRNLREAVLGTLSYVDPVTGKSYALGDRRATLMVRPRGWHLVEKHARLSVTGEAVPASLFDFGLFFFHNARQLVAQGKHVALYLPKLESHLEARLWNDVFVHAEDAFALPRGTIRSTVLIETLPAAFEMDEILYELREHSAGLNCGRWDYIFSFIKKLGRSAAYLMPDRAEVTMDQPFMRAYTQLLIKTCHARGAHAMGGMAAQIPIKNDEEASRVAIDKVRADKLREVKDGHDGTWVAHPGLVSVAREVFDAHMPGPHQIDRKREDVHVTAADLLRVPEGQRTEGGLRHNIRVGVQYLEAWLRGTGCVPLYHLMEDAATAEICRAQVWQWLLFRAPVAGEPLTQARFMALLEEEMSGLRESLGPLRFAGGRFQEARDLFARLCTSDRFEQFLTIPAYELLTSSAPSEAPG
jgi:malate synthase